MQFVTDVSKQPIGTVKGDVPKRRQEMATTRCVAAQNGEDLNSVCITELYW